MSIGLVLVVEDDEWVSRLLAGAIRDAGYDVTVHGTAQTGLEAACSLQPDCIICDVDLPDHDGYWVARNVRTQSSRVSVTPFLFLSGLDDQASRLEGFHVGADVYMTKPFRVDEVVAQVGALVQMATRLRHRRDSFRTSPPPGAEATAIEGDLSQMSIATVLTVLEMERRTGVFEVASKKRRAKLEIASGFVVNGTVANSHVSALDAVRTMLAWSEGRFSFSPLPHREAPESQRSIGALLLEAVRLEDEDARNEHELAMMRGAKAASKIPVPGLREATLKAQEIARRVSQVTTDAPPPDPTPDPPVSAVPISSAPVSIEPEEPSDEELEWPLPPTGHVAAASPSPRKPAPPKPPALQKTLASGPSAQSRPAPPPKPPAAARPSAPGAPPPGPPPRKVSGARKEPSARPAPPERSPDDSGARPIPPPPRLPPRPAPNQPPEAGGKKR